MWNYLSEKDASRIGALKSKCITGKRLWNLEPKAYTDVVVHAITNYVSSDSLSGTRSTRI
jgi:hypothetical protein